MRTKQENIINKENLIEYIEHIEGISNNRAREIVNNIIKFIEIHLCNFSAVDIAGLGLFSLKYSKPTRPFVPVYGKRVTTTSKLKVKFDPNDGLSNKVQERLDKYMKMYGIEEVVNEQSN